MTLREVHVALRYIDIRTHNNFAMKAALAGCKIPMKHVDEQIRSEKLSDPKADAIVDEALRDKQPGMKHERFRKKAPIG